MGDVTKISWGELQRWRAAPAEGMHSDEVSDERRSPRFELGPTPRVAAVFLLISHLAAPLFPRFEASMLNASTKQFAYSTVKLQERRRSFIDKKSDPAGRMRLRLKQDRPTIVHAAVICFQATTKVFGETPRNAKTGRSRRRSFVRLFLSQMGTRTQIAKLRLFWKV